MRAILKRSFCVLLSLAMIMTGNFMGAMKLPNEVTAYASVVDERPYYAKDLEIGITSGATYEVDGNSVKITFAKQYSQIHFLVPADHDFSRSSVESVTFEVSENEGSNLCAKLLSKDSYSKDDEFAVAYGALTATKENAGTDIQSVCLMNMSEGELSVTLNLVKLGINGNSGSGAGDGGMPSLQDYMNSAGGLGIGTRTGVCIPGSALYDAARMEIVTKHHNLVTCENEMKPDALLGQRPNYNSQTGFLNLNFSQGDAIADYFLKYNEEHGTDIKLRGHVLVWHSQTPDWFFRKNYDTSQGYVSKDEMLWREEQYIKTVFAHYGTGTKYENLFYGWDVVNESIDDGTNNVRTSQAWYNVFPGDNTFIKQAFVYANKYAPKHTKLFYNDYNDDQPGKRQGICNLLDAIKSTPGARIDGMGMQAHYGVSYTSITNIENAIREYSKRVSEIQLTELDFQSSSGYNGSNVQAEYERLANKYAELYNKIIELNRAGVSNVTAIVFWGTDDGHTWLSSAASVGGGADGSRPQCPLLFDSNYQPKPAFWALIEASKNNMTINTVAVQTDEAKLAKEYSFAKSASKASFVPMWDEQGFNVKVFVADTTKDQTDKITVFSQIGNTKKTVEVKRSEATEVTGGYEALVKIPAGGLKVNDEVTYDVRVTNAGNVVSYGDITNKQEQASEYYVVAKLAAQPSYVKIQKGSIVVDGVMDEAWSGVEEMPLSVKSQNAAASASAKALWDEDNLYVYMQVADANLDKAASEPYNQDSVEVFIDENNHKSGSYEEDDKQYRISYDNELSVNGSKCEGNIKSETKQTASGYVVELAMKWTDIEPVVGDVIGFDLQINDAKGGERIGTINLFDASGQGYQDTGVFGQAVLAAPDATSVMVQEVIAAINQIGTVSYPDSKADIANARDAYDALSEEQKQMIPSATLAILTEAEETYDNLKKTADDQAVIDTVVEKIKAIGEVSYSAGCKDRIDAARDAYDALTDDQKAIFKVGDLSILTKAEKDYEAAKAAAEQQAQQAAFKALDDLIEAIALIDDWDAKKVLIDKAKEEYGKLTDAQKAQATDRLAAINAAEESYKQAVAQANQAIIDDVVAKIDAIGEVAYTPECKIKIDTAKYAFNQLTDEQKSKIAAEKTDLLAAAENTYNELKAASDAQKTEDEKNQARADEVSAFITQITQGIDADNLTNEDKQKIVMAQAAYEELTDAQKELVSAQMKETLNNLIAKKQQSDALAEAAKKEAEGKAAASVVTALIEAIGTVDGSQECRDRIVAAEEAYKVLKANNQDSFVQKASVDALATAREKYDAIIEADNQAAVNAVIRYINAIGTVDSSDACKTKIDAAEDAYKALSEAQKAKISAEDLAKLENAKEAYKQAVKEAEDSQGGNQEVPSEAEKVTKLIQAIGTVDASRTCKARIDAARNAYDALSEAQKAEVGSSVLATLTKAEETYAALISSSEDKTAVNQVISLIEAIGTVELTDACRAKIYDARQAYKALTTEQKKAINSVDYGILVEAEATLKALEDEAAKPSEEPQPSQQPSENPSQQPSENPSQQPSENPSQQPSVKPSVQPSVKPSTQPSVAPSTQPSADNTVYFAKFTDKTTAIQKGKSSSALAKDIEIAAGDKIVSWKSSDKKIVAVSKNGKIKAKKTGKAVITVTTAKGKKTNITVNVKKKVVKAKKLKVTNVKKVNKKQTITLQKSKTFVLKTKLTPLTTNDKVSFTSSNKKVATVTKNGKITAKKAGSAKITAKAGKKKVTVYVNVK